MNFIRNWLDARWCKRYLLIGWGRMYREQAPGRPWGVYASVEKVY